MEEEEARRSSRKVGGRKGKRTGWRVRRKKKEFQGRRRGGEGG